ncbi:MAG: VOC family protein [Pyrinomonadaceae bacterium]
MKARIHHVNVTVPKDKEAAAKYFYGVVMRLHEVPGTEKSRSRGGAWYQLGQLQLHLSIQESYDASASKRHVCYTVENLTQAEQAFRAAGVEIISDDQPVIGWSRFYVRDPGGNRLEIAQAIES